MAIIGGGARQVTVGFGDTMAIVRSSLKEVVIDSARSGVLGAVTGGVIGLAIIVGRNPRALASLSRTQVLSSVNWHARVWARDLSVIAAATSGIESIMRGIRGKDDLTSSMVSGAGSGLALSFVSQGLKIKPARALSLAAAFAVLSGAIYKKMNIPPGARLLILDHIKRYHKMVNRK